tara:strand:- start:2732 stop:3340 length:609 start_codon:yes stop_codon:yes gene_type:complete
MLETDDLPLIIAIGLILLSTIIFYLKKPEKNDSIIFNRRSITKYNNKKVSDIIINRAISAAILAPNHFLTEPWRFYLCGKKTRDRLINLNLEKKDYFEKIPYWMVVTLKSKYAVYEKLYYEDYSACSCAIQNFMLSLSSDNVGSKWVTGALGIKDSEILNQINCSVGEKFMGVIWFGYPHVDSHIAKTPERKLGKKVFKILD